MDEAHDETPGHDAALLDQLPARRWLPQLLRLLAAGFALMAITGFFKPTFVTAFEMLNASLSEHRVASESADIITDVFQEPAQVVDRGERHRLTLMVDTEPSGSTIFIDGEDRGPSPMMLSLDCYKGDKIAVRIERRGYRLWQRQVTCDAGTTVRIKPKLARAP
ncbi:MAG: PEGA domain-containing protein [Myxococcota bacterium]